MDTIISLESVSILQNNQSIFIDISLEVKKGEFLYLIGDTGSGKSSLFKTLYRELKVSKGDIQVGGFNLMNMKEKEIPFLRRKLGIVFQDFQLLSDRNIHDNLKFVLQATGWKDKRKISKRIDEVLENVHLENIKNKMTYELSGGEQQRIVIARALLNHPEIILADEPTGNLDPKKSDKIIELLKEINTNGTTVIVATHDYSIIKKYPSHTFKCENKKIVEVNNIHL